MNQFNDNITAAGYGQITSVNNVPNNYSNRMVVDNNYVNGTNNMNMNPPHSMYYHDSKSYYNNVAQNMPNAGPMMQDPTMESYGMPAYHNIQRQSNVNDSYFDPNHMNLDPFGTVGGGSGPDDMNARLNQLTFDNDNFFDPNRMQMDPFASFANADNANRQMNHNSYGDSENYYQNDATMRTIASNVNGSNNVSMGPYSSMYPVQNQLCDNVSGNHYDQNQMSHCPPYMDLTPAPNVVEENTLMMNNVSECQQNIIGSCLPSVPNITNEIVAPPSEIVGSATSDILRNTLLSNNAQNESLQNEPPQTVLPPESPVTQPIETQITANTESTVATQNTLTEEVDCIPNIQKSTSEAPEILAVSNPAPSPTNTNQSSSENANTGISPHAISLVEIPEETLNNYDFISGGGEESEDPLQISHESDNGGDGMCDQSDEFYDPKNTSCSQSPRSNRKTSVPSVSRDSPNDQTRLDHSAPEQEDPFPEEQRQPSPTNNTADSSGGFVCQLCCKTFDDETELESHKSIRRTYYKCVGCSARFSSECAFNGHQLSHHHSNATAAPVDSQDELSPDEKTSFPCEYCGYVYTTKYSLIRHVKNNTIPPVAGRSRQNAKPFGCEKCDKTFAAKCSLLKHRRAEHPFELVPDKMSHVTYPNDSSSTGTRDTNQTSVFSTVRTLQPIGNYTPGTKTNRCRCKFCDDTFSSAYCRDQHERLVHADQAPLSCHICDQTFMYRLCLEEHLIKHERVKNEFRCDVCLKNFASRRNLRRHKPLHDRGNRLWSNSSLTITPTPSLTVTKTPAAHSITVRSIVNAHQPSPNNNVLTPPARPMTYAELSKLERRHRTPFICEFCGKTFPYKVNFIEHYLTHTGERPFKCDVCDRGFIRERPMQEHRAQHDYEAMAGAEEKEPSPPARNTEAELQTLMWTTEQGRRITRGTLAAVFKSEEPAPESRLNESENLNEIDLDLVKTEPIEFAEATYDPPPSVSISSITKSTSSPPVYNNVRTKNCQPSRMMTTIPIKRESFAPTGITTRYGGKPPDYTHLIPTELREQYSRTPIVSLFNLNANRITGTVHVCSLCDKFFPLYSSLVGHKKTCAYLSRKRAERALEAQKQLENKEALTRLTSSLNSKSLTIFPTKQPAVSILPVSKSGAVSITPTSKSAVTIFPTNTRPPYNYTGPRGRVREMREKTFYIGNIEHRIVIEGGERFFECGRCGKRFGRKWNLTQHNRVHTKPEKAYRCNLCGDGFPSKTHLVIHNCRQGGGTSSQIGNTVSVPGTSWTMFTPGQSYKSTPQTITTGGSGSVDLASLIQQYVKDAHIGAPPRTSQHDGEAEGDFDESIFEPQCIVNAGNSPIDQNYYEDEDEQSSNNVVMESTSPQLHHFLDIDDGDCVDDGKLLDNGYEGEMNDDDYYDNGEDANDSDPNDDGSDDGTALMVRGSNLVCAQCNSSFKQREDLFRHYWRQHRHEKSFKCYYCSKVFQKRKYLTRHARLSHMRMENYQCKYCEKMFRTNTQLVSHERVHTGEKPYQCDQCDKSFRVAQQLTLHYRFHTGEKPYPCGYCGEPFARQDYLQRHLKHCPDNPSADQEMIRDDTYDTN